ncbi:thioredoxin [Notoacmeibacter marinus]|uniref:Thioredoxin n=1 Tax=Notoacmeibacter marinus TaxID=1876515 RepID=A0A231V260_9HYPH|nr:thioredoxin [Notoacmeibacter marinus]OXT02197.1 thioredoxin [Notoacmeibacter marinus]
MTVRILTSKNFEINVLKREGVSVVRFWAEWCGPCRMMQPMYASLAEELAKDAEFGEVDVEADPDIASAFGIRGVPTVIFFKDGKPASQIVGVATRSKYAETVSQLAAA